MHFVGRSRELGYLRSALDRKDASIVRVSGLRGGGKSALVRRAVESFTAIVHRAPPLPDQPQRGAVRRLVQSALDAAGLPTADLGTDPDWQQLLAATLPLADPARPSFVIVLDNAHRLVEARARYLQPLLATLRQARSEGRPLHVILVGSAKGLPNDDELGELAGGSVPVGPLPFRAAAELLPSFGPDEALRAYATFGGIPRVLEAIDPTVTTETNVRRLMLDPGARFAEAAGEWLERDVQTPIRYYAILMALARGEADWAAVHAGVPDLTTSGQVAPYLHRLEELGLVSARRSLDARPQTRSRRYRITDPFLSFWFGFMLKRILEFGHAWAKEDFGRDLRADVDRHLDVVFPEVCRQHMEFDSLETLGANGREVGSLWGVGYDIPVAGILASGGAFYGSCHARPIRPDETPLDTLDEQVRETRYGFGRQARISLVFAKGDPPRWLQRETAKRPHAHLISTRELLGSG